VRSTNLPGRDTFDAYQRSGQLLGRLRQEPSQLSQCHDPRVPVHDHIRKVNSIYHIESHVLVRHEDYDVLSTGAGVGVEREPGTNKFATFGFSKPSRDPFDPKTQVACIDWYQEVRRYDSLRANFPDDAGRIWLQISAEKPFDCWCLTTDEYCVRDMGVVKNTTAAACYAMNSYRADTPISASLRPRARRPAAASPSPRSGRAGLSRGGIPAAGTGSACCGSGPAPRRRFPRCRGCARRR